MRDRASGLLTMPRRILVVEDDPTLGRVIQDNLVSESYDVEVVTDGACAIRSTRTTAPDLIILDLTLPDCDGFDLLPIVRGGGQVPIIILTARTEQAEKLSGLRLGADDYITKPFNMEELVARAGRGASPRPAQRQPYTPGGGNHRFSEQARLTWEAYYSFYLSRVRAPEVPRRTSRHCSAPR